MHRRALLASLGSSLLLGTAGCLSDSNDPNAPTGTSARTTRLTATGTETETRTESTATGTPTDGPYVVPGAERTFTPAAAEVRNESDDDATVTVAVEHEGERFFERTFDVPPDSTVTSEPVVASHAAYDVFVATVDGRETTSEWTIPDQWNWPTLAVLVAGGGALRVGYGFGGERPVIVKNRDEPTYDVTLELLRGETVVAEATRSVPPGDETVALDVPIGDRYRLRAEVDGASDTAEYVDYDCWATDAAVRINGGTPSVEAMQYICD